MTCFACKADVLPDVFPNAVDGTFKAVCPTCKSSTYGHASDELAAEAFHQALKERPASGVMESRGGKVIDQFGRVVLTVNVNDLSIDESRQVMDIILGALADAGY